MKIIYKKEFSSVVKAAILKEVRGYEPIESSDLTYPTTESFNLNELFIEWDWLNGTPHNISGLEHAVNLAMRHKHCSMSLIFSTITQALKYGVDFVLTRRSRESRQFCNLVLSVREELRNAKMNIKFIRTPDALIGHYLPSHNISDLLQSFYQKRFPDKKIVISPAPSFLPQTRLPSSIPPRVPPLASFF